jgi:hypothetical protein
MALLLVPMVHAQTSEELRKQKVELQIMARVPCIDVTYKAQDAYCTYFTVNGKRFSVSHSKDTNERIVTVYYDEDGSQRPVTEEEMLQIAYDSMEGSI